MFMDEIVGRTLRLLEKSGIKKADLAKKIDVSAQNVNNWLVRRGHIPGDKIFDIAKALGVSADYLRYGEERRGKPTHLKESVAPYNEEDIISNLRELDASARMHVLAIIRLLAKN